MKIAGYKDWTGKAANVQNVQKPVELLLSFKKNDKKKSLTPWKHNIKTWRMTHAFTQYCISNFIWGIGLIKNNQKQARGPFQHEGFALGLKHDDGDDDDDVSSC